MANALAQVTIPSNTGIPADVQVNTWSFQCTDVGDSVSEIGAFLTVLYSALVPLSAQWLDFSGFSIKLYDRADPEPRNPVGEGTFDLGNDNNGNAGLPAECTSCLSFRGVYDSGEPKARRRGRVYLPTPYIDALIQSGASATLVAGGYRETVLDAYEAAWDELTNAGTAHEVWSPTDAEGRPVVEAWMDNAWDIQRRRGPRPTSRDTRSGPF